MTAPPQPRHIVAQQVLALCLQENKIGRGLWPRSWNGLAPFDRSAEPIVQHLLAEGFLEQDGELLFIGPQAEAKFGRRHFMGMTTVFTAPPQFTVLSGRQEIGRTDPTLLTDKVEGPRLLLLAGRNWRVTWIDWKRRRCFVEPMEGLVGKARWLTAVGTGAGFTLTWAGFRANATLAATLSGLTDDKQRFDDDAVRLRCDLTPAMWTAGTADAARRLCLPDIDERALKDLKFSEALPERLAIATLAARLVDLDGAARVLAEPTRFVSTIS